MPTIPDDLVLTGTEAARLADQLLRDGRPFHAHEVLEASWKSAPPHERDLWQGLAQIAVGLTHAHRGNPRGAVTLLRRGARRVRAYCDQPAPSPQPAHPSDERAPSSPPGEGEPRRPPRERNPGSPYGEGDLSHPRGGRDPGSPYGEDECDHPYGMDIAAVLADCDDLAARIEREGLASIPAADLRPKLMSPGS